MDNTRMNAFNALRVCLAVERQPRLLDLQSTMPTLADLLENTVSSACHSVRDVSVDGSLLPLISNTNSWK